MKEFWLWVTIVSLIIVCILALFLLVFYLDKKTNQETRRVEMMIQRLEESEKAKKRELKDE